MHAREIASRLRGLAEFFNRDQTLMVGTAQRMDRDGGRCRNYADEIGMSLNTNRTTIRDLLKLAAEIEAPSEDESIVTHGLRRSEDPRPVEAGLERRKRQFIRDLKLVRSGYAVATSKEVGPAPRNDFEAALDADVNVVAIDRRDEVEVVGAQSDILNLAEKHGGITAIRYQGDGGYRYCFVPKMDDDFGRSTPDVVSASFARTFGDGRGA